MSDYLEKRMTYYQHREGCQYHFAPMDVCSCAENNMIDEIERLTAERDVLHTAGIVEIAARNPNVMDYIRHWEGRTERAEAERDELAEALRATHDACVVAKTLIQQRWGSQSPARNDAIAKARAALAKLEGQKDE